MEKRETRRRLIVDLNENGSISGAIWEVIIRVMDGKEEVARKTEQREAAPDEWAAYLGEGNAHTLRDMKAAHLQIAEEREAAKRREDALTREIADLKAAHAARLHNVRMALAEAGE